MKRIVSDSRVSDFIAAQIGPIRNPHVAIGIEEDGRILGGAIFERCNGFNVFFHGASDGSGKWLTRGLVQAWMRHAFEELKVPRITTVVAASNHKALAFDAALGFVEEQRLKNAAHDGSDSIYLVLWRENCKWLNSTSS